jgi:hypothetical protein
MKINTTKHPQVPLDREGQLSGLGANAVWAGPWNSEGYPKGKGSSSGITGMIFNNDKPQYHAAPITQRAKPQFLK